MSSNTQNDGGSVAPEPGRRSKVATWALYLAILAGLVLAVAGPLYRMEFVDLSKAFMILMAAPIAAIGIVLVAVWGLVRSRMLKDGVGTLKALAAIVISAVVIAMPANQALKGRSVPPIHDITTDLQDPPVFVDVTPLRQNAETQGMPVNPTDYEKDGGAELAAKQSQAFPDIKPLDLSISADAAFDKALAVAEHMGWDIVAQRKPEGRIEATDTTFWMGFKDDVVIRIRATSAGSRVDIRSESRIGVSDLGVNARRVRAFLAAMQES